MRLAPLLIIALLLAAPAQSDNELIPVDVLFSEPETYSHSYRLSPDGRYLASYLNFDGDRILALIDTSTTKTYGLIDFRHMPGVFISRFEWVDNDTLFLRWDGDRISFVDFRFVNDQPKRMVRKTRAKGRLVDPLPSVEDTVLFARNIPGESGYGLHRIAVAQLEKSRFPNETEFRDNLDDAVFYHLDPGSRYLLAATLDGDLLRHWYMDENRRRWVDYFEHDPTEYEFWPVGRLRGDTFAVLTNRDTDRISLFEFNVATKQFGELLHQHARYDLTGAEVSEDLVRSVSYVDHGRTVTEYFAESDSHIARLTERAFPEKNAQLLTGTDTSRSAVLYVSASDDPGTYYLLDLETGNADILSSRYPAVERYGLARSEVFTVTAADGERIEAILTRPAHSNGVLLVNPHGGPIGFRDDADYDPAVQFFANRGYSVLNVNFRGSSGFGRQFLEAGRGQFGKRIEEDISTVVDKVMSEHEFTQLCAIGTSYGGYSSVMLAIRHPELYRCAVSMFGVFDLPLVFNGSNFRLLDEVREMLETVVGENSDALKEVSPFYRAEQIEAPVLLIAGTEDEIADIEHTNRLKYRLQELSKPVEHFYYPGTGHGHRTWLGDRHQFALIDDFIRRKLGLEPPTALNTATVLGAEYAMIAANYEESTFIDENIDLALRYYEKAAGLGDALATYRLGRLYTLGTEGMHDLELAYDYLERASDLGSSAASYWLALAYRDGTAWNLTREVDPRLSLEYLRKAQDQGHELARFDIARALCTGLGVDSDIEKCLSLLSFDREDEEGPDAKEKANKRTAVFAQLAWSSLPDPEAKARINEFIGSSLEAGWSGLEFKLLRSGLLRESGYIRGDKIPAEKDTRFGITFRIDADGSDGGKVVVKGRLTGPPTTSEKDRIIEEFLSIGNDEEKDMLYYEIVDDRDRVEGEWRLEVRTLDDQVLCVVTWQVGRS